MLNPSAEHHRPRNGRSSGWYVFTSATNWLQIVQAIAVGLLTYYGQQAIRESSDTRAKVENNRIAIAEMQSQWLQHDKDDAIAHAELVRIRGVQDRNSELAVSGIARLGDLEKRFSDGREERIRADATQEQMITTVDRDLKELTDKVARLDKQCQINADQLKDLKLPH